MVRLTRRQHERVKVIVESSNMRERWRYGVMEWLERDAVIGGSHRIDVGMPAIAWMRVAEVMFDHCYDARGFRNKTLRQADLNAMKAIQHGLNVRTVHPALSGVSAIGMIGELIPAWKLFVPTERASYSPFPAEGAFVILAPESTRTGGQAITTWVEAKRAPERPLLDEREHLRFAS
jgi:hypothetical protein